MNKFLKVFMASIVLLASSCSHQQIMVNKSTDHTMTCDDISSEMVQVEKALSDIDSKTGVSGRNVGMALVFWPGILVNQMNAGDAKKMATERMSVLASLRKEKNCNKEQVKASPPTESKVESAANTVEQKEEAVAEPSLSDNEVKAEVK